MRRKTRPEAEVLEGKMLLSVSSPADGLATSLTAVVHQSAGGTQVVVTFTETNATDHDIRIAVGPSIDGFAATRDGKALWVSNPGIQPYFLTLQTLKPHQSLTLSATWDGRSDTVDPLGRTDGPPLSGEFTISNALDRGRTAGVTIPGAAPSPGPKATHVHPPKPPAHRT